MQRQHAKLNCMGEPMAIHVNLCSSMAPMVYSHRLAKIPLLHFIGFTVLVSTLLSPKELLHTLNDGSKSKCHS
jgi:hypothetical protein